MDSPTMSARYVRKPKGQTGTPQTPFNEGPAHGQDIINKCIIKSASQRPDKDRTYSSIRKPHPIKDEGTENKMLTAKCLRQNGICMLKHPPMHIQHMVHTNNDCNIIVGCKSVLPPYSKLN